MVWAPIENDVSLKIVSPSERIVPMLRDRYGYWKVAQENVEPGMEYFFLLGAELERPDPASRFQPSGVHGPSAVVDHSSYVWGDSDWRGIPLSEMIIYELHSGTFTPEGTFEAIIPRIGELAGIGINAIELMPVAQFPGERNWGYDGVYPFAVQNSYGGPGGLKRLVDECHRNGMAVILDVVYNHLGPEGNYLRDFGPYFTPKYKTPWGDAINFDGPYSDGVRDFFIENAVGWLKNYHIDALRLDAIHSITDMSATPFLQELARSVEVFSAAGPRKAFLIAESDLNDARVIRTGELGGFGFDAQWCDDFHHSLHVLLTGESGGYYADFGTMKQLAKAWKEGYVYSGQYSVYRKKRHGNSSGDRPSGQFIVFSQNHDQIGNRFAGERLSSLVSFEKLKLAAGAVMLSPFIPLLFMGEEYGEKAPFFYFISHSDPELIDAVRNGRMAEFCESTVGKKTPDPHSEETFLRSKVHWEKRSIGQHGILLEFYKELIRTRKAHDAFTCMDRKRMDISADEGQRLLSIILGDNMDAVCLLFNFNKSDVEWATGGRWVKILDSSEERWGGTGSLVPDVIPSGETVKINKESFAVFLSCEE